MNISNSGEKLRSNYSKILVNYSNFSVNIVISWSMTTTNLIHLKKVLYDWPEFLFQILRDK